MCEDEPLLQGDLDEYCGQYALINALKWLKPEIQEQEMRSIFSEMMARISEIRKGKRSARVTYGLSCEEMETLMSMIYHEYGMNFRAITEDEKIPAWTFFSFWRSLENFFDRAKSRGVVLTRIKSMTNHWTVVTSVNDEKLELYDSRYMNVIERAECSIFEEDDEHFYRIGLHDTYLIYISD